LQNKLNKKPENVLRIIRKVTSSFSEWNAAANKLVLIAGTALSYVCGGSHRWDCLDTPTSNPNRCASNFQSIKKRDGTMTRHAQSQQSAPPVDLTSEILNMALVFTNCFLLLSKQRSRLFLLATTTLLLLAVQHARCESEEESPAIRIFGLPDGGVQALPSHYVKSFQCWFISKSGQKGDALSIERVFQVPHS
jgi:hypothetical protein